MLRLPYRSVPGFAVALVSRLEEGLGLLAEVLGAVRMEPEGLLPLLRIALATLTIGGLPVLQVKAAGGLAGGGCGGAGRGWVTVATMVMAVSPWRCWVCGRLAACAKKKCWCWWFVQKGGSVMAVRRGRGSLGVQIARSTRWSYSCNCIEDDFI